MPNYSTANNHLLNSNNYSLNSYNKIYDNYSNNSGLSFNANVSTNRQKGKIPYTFTNDPTQLKGEILTTVIQKGNKGLGFTLIGNDGSNSETEFIQVHFFEKIKIKIIFLR